MTDIGPWLRERWQLIAAPALIIAIIAFAILWLRPASRQVTGPFRNDNPGGVVEGYSFRPEIYSA